MTSPQITTTPKKIIGYIKEILVLFVKKILIYDLILIGLIALSFLFWGDLTAEALSERLVIVGLLVALIGGILAAGQTTGGRNWGQMIVSRQQAELLTDFNIEVRQDVERKFSPIWRFFTIGIFCFLVGILVQVLFA
jgi:hypothetical protein